MSKSMKLPAYPSSLTVYQIRIEGHVSLEACESFEEMDIVQEENGETSFTGTVIDQSALHGLLRKIRGLEMPLVSIVRLQDVPSTK